MQTRIPPQHGMLFILIVSILPGCAEEVGVTKPAGSTKRVLFVCVENSNRSQMAEAFARRLGQGKVEAYSAGSRPSGRVNPRAVEFMREIGYDLTAHRSKGLADLPDAEFDVVVTMGCGDECPVVRAKRREDWAIPDPKELPPDEFRAVRDLIEKKVRLLLESL